jgi:hypothetical protein
VINALILRQLSVVSILLLAVSSIHAGEWSGNVSRQASEVDTLCVELDKKNSPYLQKICLKKINVKWTLKTSEQSALVRSSVQWQLQPTLWLRTTGESPLSSFSKAIQTAYQATVPTEMTLAAFLYPEVNSAPSNADSGFDDLGIALEIGAGNLKKSEEGFSFSTPSSPGWDTLLNDAPSHVPCIISKQKKTPDYIPGEVSKELVRDGISLSGLTLCQLSFADLKQFNNAMQATKANSESQTVDKGISLDDLLADIDPVISDDLNIELAPKETANTSTSLDDLLAEVDPIISADTNRALVSVDTAKANENHDDLLEGAEENIKQKQPSAYRDGSYCGGLLSSLEDQYQALIKGADELCQTQVHHINELIETNIDLFNNGTIKMSDGDVEKFNEHHNELAHCFEYETLRQANFEAESMRTNIVYIDFNREKNKKCQKVGDYQTAHDHNRYPIKTEISNRVSMLDFVVIGVKRLLFDIGENNNFQRGNKIYTSLVNLRDYLVRYLEEDMSRAREYVEKDLAALGEFYGYDSVLTVIVDNAIPISQPEINNEPLPELTAKPIEASPKVEDKAKLSYPKTSSNTPIQPPNDTCYFADGRRASGSELPACVALNNNSEKRNTGNCGNNDGSGGGCDKTQ